MTGNELYGFKDDKCKKNYEGNLTVLGKQIDRDITANIKANIHRSHYNDLKNRRIWITAI